MEGSLGAMFVFVFIICIAIQIIKTKTNIAPRLPSIFIPSLV